MAQSGSTINAVLGVSAAVVALYAAFLGGLANSSFLGRTALYANQFNTLFWHDLNYPLQFGFADGQVTPFNIETPDGETLYAWHVLPLDVYARHEPSLRTGKRHEAPVNDFTKTLSFKLLTEHSDPPPRVVISFHGNAGHIAQGMRAGTYRELAIHPNTHVFTIDYRGFGHSTGSPDEAGLIVDGTALVNWVMKVAGVPSERIVILGQSLGTAVSSAVALNFADPSSELIPRVSSEDEAVSKALATQVQAPTSFAGVVLVAPFSSIPSLLLTYRMGGIVPLLFPLRPFPWLANKMASMTPDKWPTALRLESYYKIVSANKKLQSSTTDDKLESGQNVREMAAVQIIHAIDDRDITYHQTEFICAQIVGPDARCVDGGNGPALFELKEKNAPRIRFEIVQFGGHNTVITYSQSALAIIRAFEGFPPRS